MPQFEHGLHTHSKLSGWCSIMNTFEMWIDPELNPVFFNPLIRETLNPKSSMKFYCVFFSVLALALLPNIACSQLTSSTDSAERSTHARFVPERADDFAWENDLIAFRAYGPALREKGEDSGFDAWLKRVPYPIVDKWYAAHLEGISYHKDHGEGYDPYKVGASRGCGGLGLWLEGALVTSNVYTRWKIIESTRERTTFVLHYEWTHAGDVYTEAKAITIELGDRLFQSTSTFRKNGALAASLPIAIGIVRHNEDDAVSHDLDAGWMAIWETIDGSGLGTGVVIDPLQIEDFRIVTGDGDLDDHALIITKTDARGQLTYYTGFGWARAGAMTSEVKWTDYLAGFLESR